MHIFSISWRLLNAAYRSGRHAFRAGAAVLSLLGRLLSVLSPIFGILQQLYEAMHQIHVRRAQSGQPGAMMYWSMTFSLLAAWLFCISLLASGEAGGFAIALVAGFIYVVILLFLDGASELRGGRGPAAKERLEDHLAWNDLSPGVVWAQTEAKPATDEPPSSHER